MPEHVIIRRHYSLVMPNWFDSAKDTLYGGIDVSLPGVGGPKCAAHVPLWLDVLERVFSILVIVLLYVWSARKLSKVTDDDVRVMRERDGRLGGSLKKSLLMLLAFVFGMELTYKIVSRQLLFVMNPCHIITIAQLYLLCVLPNKLSIAVFRVMLHNVFGTFLGVLFAVTNTRKLSGEIPVYWVQHILVCLMPLYIMYLWGPRCIEPLSDWSWTRVSLIAFGHYHHHILVPLSNLTYVNLNFTLCPSPSDPFGSTVFYRTILHFAMPVLVSLFGKVYSLVSFSLLNYSLPKSKEE